MKILKIFLRCVFGAVLLLVFLFLCFFVFLLVLSSQKYTPPLHQQQNEIVRIELLDTHTYSEESLYVLQDSEIQDFLVQLHSIKFKRYINDPAHHYGVIAVKIVYQNGYYDILGLAINSYRTPDGKNIATDGWYYISNQKDLVNLFSQYIDVSLLPDKMTESIEQ